MLCQAPLPCEITAALFANVSFELCSLDDEHVCSDLVLFDTPANPFRVLVEFWSYLPDIVSDPLVSVSAVHRISKTQSALEVAAYVPGYKYELRRNRLLSVKHPLVPVVFRHQQRMAGALAAMVADAEQCEHRGLLEAITTLILCEVSPEAAAAFILLLVCTLLLIARTLRFNNRSLGIGTSISSEPRPSSPLEEE